MKNKKEKINGTPGKGLSTRSKEDLELKKQLLLGADDFIINKGSDAGLDKLSLKVKLAGGDEFIIDDYIAEHMEKHHRKFVREWFYKIADLYGDNRIVMDVYIKPDYVRRFIIQFVYGRFPYMILRTLRSRNRKNKGKGKLFQYLKKDISRQLDSIIAQVYETMCKSEDLRDFNRKYAEQFKLYFQVELF